MLGLLLLAACVKTTTPVHPKPPPPRSKKPPAGKKTTKKKKVPRPAANDPRKTAALPAGFKVVSADQPVAPFLKPRAMWRYLVSRLTTLRADARAKNEDILVSFHADAFHITDRSGRRRSWQLPKGLRLLRVPSHVVLGADLSTAAFGPDLVQLPSDEEVTVIEARVEAGDVEIFRLIVKGGQGFRSISSHG